MLFHILRAFFRIEIAIPVRGRFFTENRACGAGFFTNLTISAPVFNDGQFRLHRQIGQNGGKAHLTAVVRGYKQTAFAYEAQARQHRRRLMRGKAAIGVVFALALACRHRQSRISCVFDFSRYAKSNGLFNINLYSSLKHSPF